MSNQFNQLRLANYRRQMLWDPDKKITQLFRATELAGETGEACNVIKKLQREAMGIQGSRATLNQLADEIADVVICSDLILMTEGVDLWRAIVDKFNATSEAQGFPVKLEIF